MYKTAVYKRINSGRQKVTHNTSPVSTSCLSSLISPFMSFAVLDASFSARSC